MASVLHINGLNTAAISAVSIINMDGRKLYTSKKIDKKGIDVGHFADGVYILLIKLRDGSERTGKFVVAGGTE
ncbi:hypothetical protein D3C86_2077840 [compost metagenome]